MYTVLKSILMPPGSLIVLLAVLAAVAIFRPRITYAALVAAIFLFVMATPFVGRALLLPLEDSALVAAGAAEEADVIVILSAGLKRHGPEYGGAHRLDGQSAARVAYGAHLHRETGLPILVSGGAIDARVEETMASLMRDHLAARHDVSPVWLEMRSRNTLENAAFTACLLTEQDINTVLLVTTASHMPRSVAAFEQAGLVVIPAGTEFTTPFSEGVEATDFFPSHQGLAMSYAALHEYIGQAWYRFRYSAAMPVCSGAA